MSSPRAIHPSKITDPVVYTKTTAVTRETNLPHFFFKYEISPVNFRDFPQLQTREKTISFFFLFFFSP